MEILKRDLKLKIEDFGADQELSRQIKEYHLFLADYMSKISVIGVVHTEGICLK